MRVSRPGGCAAQTSTLDFLAHAMSALSRRPELPPYAVLSGPVYTFSAEPEFGNLRSRGSTRGAAASPRSPPRPIRASPRRLRVRSASLRVASVYDSRRRVIVSRVVAHLGGISARHPRRRRDPSTDLSTWQPRRCRDPSTGHPRLARGGVVATPRRNSAIFTDDPRRRRGVAATRLLRVSTSQPALGAAAARGLRAAASRFDAAGARDEAQARVTGLRLLELGKPARGGTRRVASTAAASHHRGGALFHVPAAACRRNSPPRNILAAASPRRDVDDGEGVAPFIHCRHLCACFCVLA